MFRFLADLLFPVPPDGFVHGGNGRIEVVGDGSGPSTCGRFQGYHFTGSTLRNGMAIPPIGVWIRHIGEIRAGQSGLHMSEHPFDALEYARGPLLHRVEIHGEVERCDKRVVGRRRRILETIDMSPILWAFARWNAAAVLDIWSAPAVVREFILTGNESLRKKSWDAIPSAAARYLDVSDPAGQWSAAWSAAWASFHEDPWASAHAAAFERVRAEARKNHAPENDTAPRQRFMKTVSEVFKKQYSYAS